MKGIFSGKLFLTVSAQNRSRWHSAAGSGNIQSPPARFGRRCNAERISLPYRNIP